MTGIPFHIFTKVQRERDSLRIYLRRIKMYLEEMPTRVVAESIMWDVDSESYNDTANKIIDGIDAYLDDTRW